MAGRKKSPPTTEFGKEMAELLEAKAASVSGVTAELGFSASHSYNVMRGAKPATPQYVNALAMAVNATDQERQRLNLAAARDNGFDLKLPEDW